MSHLNHRALSPKYKDLKDQTTSTLGFRRVDIVEYFEDLGVKDTCCLLKDRITAEKFIVPLSSIQVDGLFGIAFFELQQPSHEKEALCLT